LHFYFYTHNFCFNAYSYAILKATALFRFIKETTMNQREIMEALLAGRTLVDAEDGEKRFLEFDNLIRNQMGHIQ